MLSTTTLIIAGLAWLGVLFAVAVAGERMPERFRRIWPVVYTLSLAVHCTAWTFYGVTTQAARSGWPIPPTFVGAIVLFTLLWPFLYRLIELAKAHNSTSIADFIASRFGKSSALAAVVTAVAVAGIVPYIALQLKAVAMSFSVASAGQAGTGELPAWQDIAFYVALLMAVFAMLFGTRRASAKEHNRGLVLAVAFESLLKLAAMLAVGLFVVFGLYSGPADLAANTRMPGFGGGEVFVTLMLLGAMAMFTQPHQFHIGVVECRDRRDIARARWLFPLFLILISLPVLPIALAGSHLLPGTPSDLFVLMLPLAHGQSALGLFTFIGGISAATGMVIMASLTLSIMIGNHWLTPLMFDRGGRDSIALRLPVLMQRRLGIVLALLLGYGYSRLLEEGEALADIGARSFSGLAQLAPAVLLAVFYPRLPARAVIAGIVAGTVLWGYVLFASQLLGRAWAQPGQLGMAWLSPDGLFGLEHVDALTRAVIASLVVNVVVMLLAAHIKRPAVAPAGETPILAHGQLRGLARRFLSAERVQALFAGDADPHRREALVEHELASVVGAASARLLLDAARRRAPAPLETVADIVGQASEQARFNQIVLEGALENMSQGICVVDEALRLVAWNRRYLELFDYPPELIRVGRPVADLLRHNARRGLMGQGDDEDGDGSDSEIMVERRLAHMRAGHRQLVERDWSDGSIIEIRGNPMPGGGFVATFTDVTDFRRAEQALKRINETLEQRVAERTAALEAAKTEAETANEAKSRFLAAVSHDLVQPLNAARLFTHALTQNLEHDDHRLSARQIDGALDATESLLSDLLDISRLDGGRLIPRIRRFPLGELIEQLASEFQVLARERGLELCRVPTTLWVESDPQLLRRILQNFLSNAVRYTGRGRVLLGCRRHGNNVRLEVWDTGPGIAESEQALVFEEFRRLEASGGAPGLGLGLAIARRMAQLLKHEIQLRSWPGSGTVFALRLPRVPATETTQETATHATFENLPEYTLLVIDNDPSALQAMQALLSGWRCQVLTAQNGAQARLACQRKRPDAVLLDYHLDGGENGLDLLQALEFNCPAVLITADHSPELRQRCEAAGLPLLNKPLKPLKLRAVLGQLRMRG